jgi:predicted nuclease with TOPRIM domain
MESEKVKDIKEGLECLSGHKPCNLCSYHELAEMQETCCINVVVEEVIEYINELESENDCKDIEISKQEYQIEKLKDRIAELEKKKEENPSYAKGYADGIKNTYEVVLPDKLKQFAERIKMEFYYQFDELIPSIMADKIDETLKEFIK